MEEWLAAAKEAGFSEAYPLDVSTLKPMEQVREACGDGKCRAYGHNWTCPPFCGTLEECEKRMRKYKRGILLQTVGKLERDIDTKGYMRAAKLHGEALERYKVKAEPRLEQASQLIAEDEAPCDTYRDHRQERWDIEDRYYTKVIEDDDVTVRLVMVDTAPMIDKYREDTEKYPDACKQDLNKQLAWIDSVLTNAKEDWVLVVGHHPIYAETSKSNSERADLQKRLDSILRKHNNVAMYLCGHIHNFQHIRVKGSNIDYVVNSSGSLSRDVKPIEGTKFCSGEEGFSLITADKKEIDLHMINKEGKVIYTVKRTK